MPRRKRNRKAKKQHTRTTKTQKCDSPVDVARTCPEHELLNQSKITSPLPVGVYSKTPSPRLEENCLFDLNVTSLMTTPLSTRRSINKRNDTSWNVTNLNFLFEPDLHCSNSEIRLKKSGSVYRRSSSSIAKLHSPGKEAPRLVHKETQTCSRQLDAFNSSENNTPLRVYREIQTTEKLESCNVNHIEILETPKLNQVIERSVKITKRQRTLSCSSKMTNFATAEVNINPYLRLREKQHEKDKSFGEVSFFCPQLFELNPSSTPIEKNLIKNNSEIKDNVNIDITLGTDRTIHEETHTSVSMNNTPLLQRNSNHNINLLLESKKTTSHRSIPNNVNNLTGRRLFGRNLTYSKLSISRRDSTELFNHVKGGACERMFNKIRKYGRMSGRWYARLTDMCTRLGVSLKNSFTSLCQLNLDNSLIDCPDESRCKCKEYREEINSLTIRIQDLSSEILSVKHQLELHKQSEQENNKCIQNLQEEMNQVKTQLSQYEDLRNDLKKLREQFTCVRSSAPALVGPPTPASLPPPPPPPPPPLPIFTPKNAAPIKKVARSLPGGRAKGEERPIISLDDILKVKLKKTSERASLTPRTPISRRSTQPPVSKDVLKQIKLKPVPRIPDTPVSDTPSSISTSPHSSLCRLLTSDSSVCRLKRLRKVGGYSFDSVYRKNLTKRERSDS